jgi:hypothetical protein
MPYIELFRSQTGIIQIRAMDSRRESIAMSQRQGHAAAVFHRGEDQGPYSL